MYWSWFMSCPKRYHQPTGRVLTLPDGESNPTTSFLQLFSFSTWKTAATTYIFSKGGGDGVLSAVVVSSRDQENLQCKLPGQKELLPTAGTMDGSWLKQFVTISGAPCNTPWWNSLFVSYFTYVIRVISILTFCPSHTSLESSQCPAYCSESMQSCKSEINVSQIWVFWHTWVTLLKHYDLYYNGDLVFFQNSIAYWEGVMSCSCSRSPEY